MAGTLNGSGLRASTAAPTWRRFALALGVSIVFHAVAVFGLRAGIGAGAGPTGNVSMLTAHLVTKHDLGHDQGNDIRQAPAQVAAVSPDGHSTVDRAAQVQPAESAKGSTRPSGSGTLPFDYLRTGYYYPATHVHKPPSAVGDINFEYPPNSPIRDGMVFAKVLINARGGVDMVVVENAEPAGVFDDVAVRDLLNAKFSPGLMHGIPVPTQLLVEIRYKDPGGNFIPGTSISLKNR